jgi:putative hydrolase of the HAD superfamily
LFYQANTGMNKKAIIYDLDNTLYAVPSIAKDLFASLYALLEAYGLKGDRLDAVKADLKRKPFQLVAEKYGFSPELKQQGTDLLNNLTFTGTIKPFPDYPSIKALPGERFLVTTGFNNLQWSKIRGMGIEKDFSEIHIIDPSASAQTKKDVFVDIMDRYGFVPSDVLVVGDDPDSELRAAHELGIDTVLYDSLNLFPQATATHRITTLKELGNLF